MHRGLHICIAGLCMFVSAHIYAQHKDSTVYYLGYTSTGTFNRTDNSSSYLFNHDLKYAAKKKNISVSSDNKWLYGKLDNQLTNDDVSSVWDLNLFKMVHRFYYWSLLNYNSSYSLRIHKQLLAGFGVAYDLIRQKDFLLNLSDGILYDYSDISPTDSTREIYSAPRNSFRLLIHWNIGDRLVFNTTSFLQNSLVNSANYIFKSDLSLAVKLKKWLSITAAYSYNKMTRTRTENSFLTYGVTIERSF